MSVEHFLSYFVSMAITYDLIRHYKMSFSNYKSLPVYKIAQTLREISIEDLPFQKRF